jgi:tRNA threonylcarbamoyladenosine biosynthesis protein TsaB
MRVLALDAATEACSVALQWDEQLIERAQISGKAHSQTLLAMARELLAEAGLQLGALDGIVASIGPGAFTGVRITVSVAQGLAFGAGLPTVGVTTLEALAFQAFSLGSDRAIACLDARMGEVYWGCFAAQSKDGVESTTVARVGPPGSVALPGADPHAGIGRGFAAYPALGELPAISLAPEAAMALPRARDFAQLGVLRFRQGRGIDPALLQPLYLRDKVALTEVERASR